MNENDITNPPENVTLFGNELTELFNKGKDAWNAWVEDHPDAAVGFDGAYLAHYTNESVITFVGFTFPKGYLITQELQLDRFRG
jgi:hypothetical protein